jgi:predicted MPP superfamily phosphohydrolase
VTLFLFTFFLVYASVHVYAFFKAKAALSFGTFTGLAVAVFMAAMIAAPAMIRAIDRAGHEFLARGLAYVAYIWLAILFLFFSSAIVIDIYRLLVYTAGYAAGRDLSFLGVPVRQAFFIPVIFSLVASAYGFFEARDIRTEKIEIKSSKIPAGVGRLRVVQISDLHLGLILRQEMLKRVVKKIKEAGPDVLISAGDLVDGQICRLDGLSGLLGDINPRYGKFAITGNHEFYAGLEQSECFIKDSGFTLLRAESVTIPGLINIAGVDDPAARAFGLAKDISEKELLSKIPRDRFLLFLKHRPLLDKDSEGLFDLQLSGHVHKGQIFPFTLVTELYYPVVAGLASVTPGSWLYVSRGTGTWGPPIRFLAPPEITIIDLVHE